MKINLNTLASEIARWDESYGKNVDVVDVKIVLRSLGEHLNICDNEEAFATVAALISSANKETKKKV